MAHMTSLADLDKAALIERLEQQLRAKARIGAARRLAAPLMAKFRIHHAGVDWVCWIGDESCRDNYEALVSWIKAQLVELDGDEPLHGYALIGELVDRLTRVLSRLEAANS